MRIQIVTDRYLPSTNSSAKLLFDLSAELTREGHQVFVAAADDSLGVIHDIARQPEATVLRVRSPRLKGAWKPLRALHEARLSSLLWKHGREFFEQNRCDLVVFYSPTIFWGRLVQRLKRLWGCPAYLILRDIFPQWAIDAGVLRKGLAYRYFRRQELAQYAAADTIGVQSPANLDYFRQNEWQNRYSLEVLYNWCSLEEPQPPATSYRRQWGLEDQVVFLYAGNIGVAQDMDNLLRLATRLRDEPVHFLLVGHGSEVGRLQREIQGRDLRNVTWRGAVNQEDYLGMVAEFDVGLVSLDRKLKTQNFPGKLLGYMTARLPILASINPGNDLKQVLEKHEAGLVYLNGDDEAFRVGALRLARSPELRRRLGQNGRSLLEGKFSVETAAGQILSHARGENFQERRQAA